MVLGSAAKSSTDLSRGVRIGTRSCRRRTKHAGGFLRTTSHKEKCDLLLAGASELAERRVLPARSRGLVQGGTSWHRMEIGLSVAIVMTAKWLVPMAISFNMWKGA